MIEGGRNSESAIDAGIEFSGYLRNAARLHKSDELIASDIEKHVPDASALLDLYGVCHYGSKAENVFVKLAGLVGPVWQGLYGKTLYDSSLTLHTIRLITRQSRF